ncbi:MAG: hypothetical protein KGR42_09385 [Acidobacteria bacterium]|nr:hypothetical protein [Acidobacteriota bacterium]
MTWLLTLTVANPHRGQILPLARVIVLMVPVGALAFYVFVVRARKR